MLEVFVPLSKGETECPLLGEGMHSRISQWMFKGNSRSTDSLAKRGSSELFPNINMDLIQFGKIICCN